MSPGRDLHDVEHGSAAGNAAHKMTQNVPRDVSWVLSWECLSSHVAGYIQPREERSQQNSGRRREPVRMASPLFGQESPLFCSP